MNRIVDERALKDLVNQFYARVRADSLIGPTFNDAISDWDGHLEKLQAFWSSVILTSGRYKGQPLKAHIKHSDRIDAASFERWLDLWNQTTAELFEPSLAGLFQEKANKIAESLQLGIRFARDKSILAN